MQPVVEVVSIYGLCAKAGVWELEGFTLRSLWGAGDALVTSCARMLHPGCICPIHITSVAVVVQAKSCLILCGPMDCDTPELSGPWLPSVEFLCWIRYFFKDLTCVLSTDPRNKTGSWL